MNYQFIVITLCEDRKQKIIQSFKDLGVKDSSIYYLKASTPENSEEYFIDTSFDIETKKVVCCAKSHCRAIEYAARDESPDYSIVIEDDASFHKMDFLKVVQQIISKWKTYFCHCDYLSLGWIPGNNYEHYKLKKCRNIQGIDNYVFLNDFYNFGLQCLLYCKQKIQKISKEINKQTFNEFKFSLDKLIINLYDSNNIPSYSIHAVDYFLRYIMRHEIIFPPLVIEQNNVKSLLGHNNFDTYWIKFFKGYEEELNNYMSY
jgi:hypothetical protein